MWGNENWKKEMLSWKFRFVDSRQICWDTFFGFHKKNAKGKEKVVFQGEQSNYEVPNMSVMTHSFIPLLIRDKEHPMHKWHARSSIDTLKSLSPAPRTLKPLRIRYNRCSHWHHFIWLVPLIVRVDCGMSCT